MERKYYQRLFVFFVLLALLVSRIHAEPREEVTTLLANMKTDLSLLSTSIDSYKMKIAELTNTIDLSMLDLEKSKADLTKSQADLIEQKKLLEASKIKLTETEKQYSDLSKMYASLNKSYQSSLKAGRIKNYCLAGLSALLITSMISR